VFANGGVPVSRAFLGTAQAAETTGFSFVQISDSHVGFNKPANPHADTTLMEAIGKVKAIPGKPAFMIHTGDITHLSKPAEFDAANQLIGGAGLDVHYVPGEHDLVDEGAGKAYLERYGKNAKGAGWYSFDQSGVHFVGLVNVVAPPLTDTDMGQRLAKARGVGAIHDLDKTMPFGHVCAPEDIANVVRYLVSERNTYVSGEKITVHGAADRAGFA